MSGHTPIGTCYPDAWRYLMQASKGADGFLVHGSVQLSEEGARINHAWIVTAYGWAWEPQTKQWFIEEDFNRLFSPIEDVRYSAEEAAIMVARVGEHGPWSEEERTRWIRKEAQ